jgi:hypothetical protein
LGSNLVSGFSRGRRCGLGGQYAVQPGWYNWIIPLVGVAGVLLGGRERAD